VCIKYGAHQWRRTHQSRGYPSFNGLVSLMGPMLGGVRASEK